MKKMMLAIVTVLFIVMKTYGSQDNFDEEPKPLIQGGVGQDQKLEFSSVANPEQKFTCPHALFEYSFGPYKDFIDTPSRFRGAMLFYHRETGHTIILYPYDNFLHVGNIDRDKVLKRVYLDGQEHDYVEIGQHYFDCTKQGIDRHQKLPKEKNCCTVS